MNRAERIIALLTQELSPTRMTLSDDSGKHAGHSGAQPGGQTHYTLTIEAEAFRGLTKIKCHQLIYALLNKEFKMGLHALSIDAKAPAA